LRRAFEKLPRTLFLELAIIGILYLLTGELGPFGPILIDKVPLAFYLEILLLCGVAYFGAEIRLERRKGTRNAGIPDSGRGTDHSQPAFPARVRNSQK
jgi:hypothetical protein